MKPLRHLMALTWITLRAAIRSRLLAAFSVVLLIVVVGMPFLLHGDGTPEGLRRIVMGYTLGTAFGILALANLWISCALLSGEFHARTLQLTLTKPVPPWQIWLGKWLGLMVLNACLLTGAGLLATAAMEVRLDRPEAPPSHVYRAHAVQRPDLPSDEERLEVLERNMGRRLTPDERREAIARLPYLGATLDPGGTWRWTFSLDRPVHPGHPLRLRVKFDAAANSRSDIQADCSLQTPDGEARLDFTLQDFASREIEIPIPSHPFTNQTRLILAITHRGGENSGPLIVQPQRNLALLLPRSGLRLNVFKALVLLHSVLALLATLGLLLGTLFSLPVAAFCATGLMLGAIISTFVVHEAEFLDDPDSRPPAVMRYVRHGTLGIVKSFAATARPAMRAAPLRRLAAAEHIPPGEVARGWLFNGLLAAMVGCCLAALALTVREVPR